MWFADLLRYFFEPLAHHDGVEGWFILVGQAPEETVEQAVAWKARAEGLDPDAVKGALVLGYPDTDRVRDWPRWFEWRRPGHEGSLRQLRGYRRAQIERAGIPAGPN